VVNTWLQDNSRIQTARMGESLGRAGSHAPELVATLANRIAQTRGGDPSQALLAAEGVLARLVGRDALTSAFDETFRLMAWLFIAALVMVPFCRPAPQGAAPPPDAH
jgi:DHA2 family multidrug resistance protein